MIDPTPEQVEARNAALEAWQEGNEIRRYSEFFTSFEDGYNAALVASAGALLVAPALQVREDRSQSGDTDRNGGEDGPEHEWGSHPETVAADTAALIAEARALALRKVEDSADAEALQIMLGLLCDRLKAPVQVDEAKLAEAIRPYDPDTPLDAARAVAAWLRGGQQ